MRPTRRLATALILALVACACLAALAAPAARANSTGYQYYLDGNAADVTPQTQPGLLLAGGATDQDDAVGWFLGKAGHGDVVVLDAWGKDSYGQYFVDLRADSVQTFVFNNRSGAYDPFVLNALRHAEAIYFDGGNQWDYVHFWSGTPVADIIDQAARTKPVGGISAGLAILGQYVYTAELGTIDATAALKNPYQSHLTLVNDFLSLPNMGGIITDSHFVTRDRMGRTVTFLARIVKDGWAAQARGIAVEQGTTLAVEPSGHVTFFGAGGAYFLRTAHAPEVCQKGSPLTFTGVEVYRLSSSSSTFDIGTWTGHGGTPYTVSAIGGVLSSSQPGGAIY
jgi:cyanophycinase